MKLEHRLSGCPNYIFILNLTRENDGILLIGPLGTYFKWNFERNTAKFNVFEYVVCKVLSIWIDLNALSNDVDLVCLEYG